MRAVTVLVALLPLVAAAQGRAPTTGGGAPGVPVVSALGTCNAAADGKVTWLAPSNELRVCDGAAWRQVFTSREGAPLNGDTVGALRMLSLTAPEGTPALTLSGTIRWAGYLNTYLGVNNLGYVTFDTLSGRSLFVEGIASNATNLLLGANGWVRVNPTPFDPVATCSSGTSGGIRVFSSDGNSPWYCDGTTALELARVLPGEAALDLPEISGGAVSAVQTVSVPGATSGDRLDCAAAANLGGVLSLENIWPTSNTANFYIRNHSGGPVDPASMTIKCWVIR